MAWWDHDDLHDVRYKRALELHHAVRYPQENQMGHYDEQRDMDRRDRAAAREIDTSKREAQRRQDAMGTPKPGDLRINAKGEFEAWVNSLGWIPANETQYSITMWAENTFGQLRNMSDVAIRANLEMGELLRAAQALDNYVRGGNDGSKLDELKAHVAEEGADVIITLMRMFTTLNVDYKHEINKKMMVNRKRKWAVGPDGTGQHVRESRDTSKGATASVGNTLEGPEGEYGG